MEGVIYDPIPVWSFIIAAALLAIGYVISVIIEWAKGRLKRTGGKRCIEIRKTGGRRRTHAD